MIGSPAVFGHHLIAWYERCHRTLPWRAETSGPYHVLVSEAMLQQTQVATVVPYFTRFIQRFPTLADLAAADEQEVLRLWQGLGYYSRARNLQAAARMVVKDCGGELPTDRDELLKLPGVGRYTAGAVASIAFDRRAAILEGNVTRVLCRVDKIESDPRDRTTCELLWRRAEEVLPRRKVGAFNSALMELGAMVCTPRSPQCLICPVQAHCEAFAAGVQEQIPPPRKTKETPLLRRATFCIRRGDRWLIEQRPAKGRWAGMWQFVTVAPDEEDAPAKGLGKRLRGRLPVRTTAPRRLGVITHGLTHRRYEFDVFVCEASHNDERATPSVPRAWVSLEGITAYPLPRPHARIAELLAAL